MRHIPSRCHEPNHPESGTSNAPTRNDAAVKMDNPSSNENPSQPVRNPHRADVRKVKRPLLAETRTSRGRIRRIMWKTKEILLNAGYDPDADSDVDETEGPRTVPQSRTLSALALMARRS